MYPVISVILLCIAWTGLSLFFGTGLVPTPWETAACLVHMAATPALWENTAVTVSRGMAAILLTLVLALVSGITAGLFRPFMSLTSPLVAALQATPPILWITLLMVWAGTGNAVPVLVVTASVFPALFLNVAQSVADLDRRLLMTARIFQVGKWRILKDMILPGIYPYVLAGLSYALGSGWKIAAVAEFLSSSKGIGARIYWSYRMLEMPELFSWALVLIGLGVGLEFTLIRWLRRRAEEGRGGHA
jgi:NitT/TauT family transport system permease protein